MQCRQQAAQPMAQQTAQAMDGMTDGTHDMLCECETAWATSVWKSSCKTGKRLRLDQTKTDQDWKFTRLIKTTTIVQSLVYHIFKVFKTSLNQSQPVSTGLSGLKCSCHIGKEQ